MPHLMLQILAGLVLLCCSQSVVAAQALPDFCESVEPGLLNGLGGPYGQHVAPGGVVYCEGLLPKPIAIHPPEVISVKQSQSTAISFDAGTKAIVTWQNSSPANEFAHLKLRAMKSPLFALDASVAATRFEWNSDLIARLQPEWKNTSSAESVG